MVIRCVADDTNVRLNNKTKIKGTRAAGARPLTTNYFRHFVCCRPTASFTNAFLKIVMSHGQANSVVVLCVSITFADYAITYYLIIRSSYC